MVQQTAACGADDLRLIITATNVVRRLRLRIESILAVAAPERFEGRQAGSKRRWL